jgi:RHS repeat-associated protein
LSWSLDEDNHADFYYEGVNVMCITGKAEKINGGNTVDTLYDYRGDNWLVGTSVDADPIVDFDYDILGNLVTKAVTANESTAYTYYQHAVGTLVGELSSQGGPDPVYYAYGLGRVSRTQSGTTAYYHTDAQGSTRVLTEDDGSELQSYKYDAWGNEAAQPEEANDYRYCGQWDYSTDENTVWQGSAWGYRTGLMQLGCRFYDPELGRFIQPDPVLGNP